MGTVVIIVRVDRSREGREEVNNREKKRELELIAPFVYTDEDDFRDDDFCFCGWCGARFSDGGGLYCSSACEEMANGPYF